MKNQKYIWADQRIDDVDLDLVRRIYKIDLQNCYGKNKKISDLELSQYLENYLWPNFDFAVHRQNDYYLMSIVLMINEKFRENIDVWNHFKEDVTKFSQFFTAITRLSLSDQLNIKEKVCLLLFFIKTFGSLEVDLVRKELAKYIAPSIWLNLSDERREKEISKMPKLRKLFKQLKDKDAKLSATELEQANFERSFLLNYIRQLFQLLDRIPPVGEPFESDDKKFHLIFCERFIEFLIDLDSVSIIRRLFNAILDDNHVLIICKSSNLSRRPEGRLFNQMLDILQFYLRFEIDTITNEELSLQEISIEHYNRIAKLQKIVFKQMPQFKEFYLSTVSQIDGKTNLLKFFKTLDLEELKKLALVLNYCNDQSLANLSRELIEEILVFHLESFISQIEQINQLSLYPTEATIWDENLVPSQYYNSENCLAIPKLNLQFLTLQDYLIRNIHLFRLESTFEIRQDIEQSVFQMKPWKNDRNEIIYGGWARMALNIDNFSVIEIKPPKIGEKYPSRVRAEVRVAVSVREKVKKEWESLRKHDICFLITLRPKLKNKTAFNLKESFCEQVGLTYVRGCEVEGMLDQQGKLIDENSTDRPFFNNDYRTYRVWLDPNQYYDDMTNGREEVYDSFNIILRRKPKENNFKAVLETIKDLINTKFVVPDWIHDLLLGYGDASSAHYSELVNTIDRFNFNDTFLDLEHLHRSFPNSELAIQEPLTSPYTLKFSDTSKRQIEVTSSVKKYEFFKKVKKNAIPFTPTQIEAIYSGMQNGLTLIVGPPGTGKTDVAVQIISNIYHNFPTQRTLIVTHSNQALNQLFEKIMQLDIDEKHLLRLGHGEEELETEKDFSRYGRVNYVLSKRLYLLYEVGKLAKSLDIHSDVGYTCETASYFYLHHVLSKYEEFIDKVERSERQPESVEQLFPFRNYFAELTDLFNGQTFEHNLNIANHCFKHIKKIFTELEEFRAFEILRSNLERSNYLLIKEAKIIAMTCTHAALKRRELVELGFQYDNILMEEAAQILEIETFIPLLLQNPEHGVNRLKRWIMIGDHNQLPPIIKNTAFQKYGNMEQSLFKRFVRLGVPTVNLDRQGRARPSLCSLFRWRYTGLGDLEHVVQEEAYQRANAGLAFEYQFVNVEDQNGVGESEPVPYFYQNEAEAEFVVLQFIYMRLLGYPADKITILTTYNGQKQKIREVLKERCGSNPFIGEPNKISTVDKYQGMQNDYILLSLVRTKNVGHIRDVRRLVVAMSRARLGLYIFGRFGLFRNCLELQTVFSMLGSRPLQLHLLINEEYPTSRPLDDQQTGDLKVIGNLDQMTDFVLGFFTEKIEFWKVHRPDYIESVLNPNKEKQQELEFEAYENGYDGNEDSGEKNEESRVEDDQNGESKGKKEENDEEAKSEADKNEATQHEEVATSKLAEDRANEETGLDEE